MAVCAYAWEIKEPERCTRCIAEWRERFALRVSVSTQLKLRWSASLWIAVSASGPSDWVRHPMPRAMRPP